MSWGELRILPAAVLSPEDVWHSEWTSTSSAEWASRAVLSGPFQHMSPNPIPSRISVDRYPQQVNHLHNSGLDPLLHT